MATLTRKTVPPPPPPPPHTYTYTDVTHQKKVIFLR